ncbi:hypothetical protein [Hellea balneolensis]|uniref:hypothetical protein n=1 Tax=Hellea balneolensis TaxID=287478 RepID=UPI00041938F4|nr:hypothetical protein [Hellea balneolensis]
MFDNLPNIAFDPLLPMGWVIALGILMFIAALAAGLGKLRSYFLRLLAGLFLILALLNPQTVIEERSPLQDVVLVIKDESESMGVGGRKDASTASYQALMERLKADPSIDVTTSFIRPDSDGTRLTNSLIDGLGNLPASRLAGVIAITDGQVHDLPENPENLLPEDVPFHSLIIGEETARDRRISAIVAPKFGLVGEQAEFELRVDDPGFEGERANIEIKLNGETKARFPATIGNRISIPIEIERRGPNTVELTVRAAEGELTLNNNVFVAEISGIRDRMRVLLVTGEPHNGGRSWRNLLKSDPAVELVQFTILTNPRVKNTNARQSELSLIAFPTRQLFEEKLDEFDLIIFDHFRRRFAPSRSGRSRPILSPVYLQNVARYVESGGALLVATGPAFAEQESIYRSPLAAVLPTRPTGETTNEAFRPELNEKGRRHPITSSFKGQIEQNWGKWFRLIDNKPISGNVLMEGPGAAPLLVIDKIGDGRVAMLMSDQAWLWSKGFDGGGPYSEMFRRTAHWLMGEPDLDAEKLSASAESGVLAIERRTLEDRNQTVLVEKPDDTKETVRLSKTANGVYRGSVKSAGQGAYRLSSGEVSTISAIGALNPKEYTKLLPTTEILRPLAEGTGGGLYTQALSGTAPDIRRVKPGRSTAAENWMGLIAHEDYAVTASKRSPLAPGWLFFILALFAMGGAWLREGQ